MKILLLTQEPPLNPSEVVSGNAVRALQLSSALKDAGHQVVQAWLIGKGDRRDVPLSTVFRNRDELQGILMQQRPEAIIVAYWELLGLLPHEVQAPVILDYVAPRGLEELYESPATVRGSLRRLRINLRKCDLVLVGNDLQRHLMVNTMIEAGFDLRHSDPIRIVPLGSESAGPPRSDPAHDGWVFVSGGVSWPWRDAGAYRSVLAEFVSEHKSNTRLVQFGGPYRWHEGGDDDRPDAAEDAHGPPENLALEPYRDFSDFLTNTASVGIELADLNIEREYSQSFRSLEFLRHGLPLLCSSHLPIARQIDKYNAGWIVDGPAELKELLPRIVSDPGSWSRKSTNARELAAEILLPGRSAEPLLDWLEAPEKAARLEPLIAAREEPPVLGVPPVMKRIRRQFALVRMVILNRLFGQQRGRGVVMVTRGDLFPPDHGAAVRIVETARALSRQGIGVAIVTDRRTHWYLVDGDQVEERKYPLWVRLISLPAPLVKLLHYSKDIPHSNSFLYLPLTDWGFFWRSIVAARSVHAGVLQAEFPAYALPCINARDTLNCSVVLVEHNVEYDRLRQQVPELTDKQYRNLKSIEIDMCNRSDAVVCVSENDRQKLAEDGVGPDLLHTVPHGVDLTQFDVRPPADLRKKFGIPVDRPLVVYHGTFSYPPNQQALRIFSEILLPGLEEKGLECHLLAVGRDPPVSSPHPRIHFTGSVDRVGPWLGAADLCVVPLVDGGGTRMKIIDCFAARLPVISTSKGIEGIAVDPGHQALILDDWDSIVDAIIELWRKPEKATSLAQRGRALAEGMDWSEIADKYRAIYASLS